jgi:hypothetical protein
MNDLTIFPPTMEAIGQALDLFGEKRVLTGEWDEPIIISGLTVSEVAYARKFFGEMGCSVNEAQDVMALAEALVNG